MVLQLVLKQSCCPSCAESQGQKSACGRWHCAGVVRVPCSPWGGLVYPQVRQKRDKFPPGETACTAALTVSVEVVLKPGANGVLGHTPGELCHCQPLHSPL